MRRFVRTAVCIGITAAASGMLRAETAQEIAAGIVYARGGLARIQNIQTERMSGTVLIGDQQGSFMREVKRPDKVRMEIEFGGSRTVETYNGRLGWRLDSSGSSQVRELRADEKKRLLEEADLDGPFVGSEAKGVAINVLGKEMLGPSMVWKLKVTFNSGETAFYYVESTGYYILRRTSIHQGNEEAVISDTLYKDFRKIEGVLVPYSVVSFINGEDPATTLRFENVELNIGIDDKDFERPRGAGIPTPMPSKQDLPQLTGPGK